MYDWHDLYADSYDLHDDLHATQNSAPPSEIFKYATIINRR